MQKIFDLLEDKKIRIVVISILVFFFVIIMIGTIAKNKTTKDEESKKEEESTEIVMNDDLKTRLNYYISDLSTGPYCEIATSTSKEYDNDCIYRNNKTTKENLSPTHRINSLILAEGLRDDTNITVGTIVIEGKIFTNPYYMNLDAVKKEYTNLYGKDAEFNPEVVNSISNYSIKYDESKGKFFYSIEEGTNFASTYIESYEVKDNEVYVYVRVAYVVHENYRYFVYRDKEQAKQDKIMTQREYKEGSPIDESNANNFPKYRFTFEKEKDSNNLIFKEVELVG